MIAQASSVLMVVLSLSGADSAGLPLAKDGQTSYQIVKPANPSALDEYAASELARYLEQITGAQFPVVAADDVAEGKPSILIGLSVPALRHLGPTPLVALKDQEHVACSSGQNILLYGKGVHGNLHAVLEFLENSLGWRWYSVFEHPVVPRQPTVTLAPFRRQRGFSFAYRKVDLQRGMDYFYQQGINMGLDSRVRSLTRRHGSGDFSRFVSAIPDAEGGVHTLFRYVPPEPAAAEADRFPWLEQTDYFKTHPDFFSMWETGQRVRGRQLCFGNPELRRELTQNILKHIDVAGDGVLLDVAAQDNPGAFCYCPACKALDAKYRSPGGPLYDYLIELCELLKTKHPRRDDQDPSLPPQPDAEAAGPARRPTVAGEPDHRLRPHRRLVLCGLDPSGSRRSRKRTAICRPGARSPIISGPGCTRIPGAAASRCRWATSSG